MRTILVIDCSDGQTYATRIDEVKVTAAIAGNSDAVRREALEFADAVGVESGATIAVSVVRARDEGAARLGHGELEWELPGAIVVPG